MSIIVSQHITHYLLSAYTLQDLVVRNYRIVPGKRSPLRKRPSLDFDISVVYQLQGPPCNGLPTQNSYMVT